MDLTHRYAFPDRFVSGAIGEPERRVFFVQARQGSRMTNVVCERQQIKVLAEHLVAGLRHVSCCQQGRQNQESDRESCNTHRSAPKPDVGNRSCRKRWNRFHGPKIPQNVTQ